MEGDHLAKRFDISVLGELNCDLILYGLPPVLEPEREHLAKDFALTLGSSSAIFAHNISLLGSRVGFTSCIGGDPLGKFCVEHLSESGVDVSGVKRLPNKNTGVTVILPLGEKRHILTIRARLLIWTICTLTWTISGTRRTFIFHPFFCCARCVPNCLSFFFK